MVMAVAAAEATVGLAIVIAIYRNKQTPLVDEYDAMSQMRRSVRRTTDGRCARCRSAARSRSSATLAVRSGAFASARPRAQGSTRDRVADPLLASCPWRASCHRADRAPAGQAGALDPGRRRSSVAWVIAMVLAFEVLTGSAPLLEGSEEAHGYAVHLFTWIPAGDFQVEIGFLIDPLTACLLIVVTTIGLLVHVYSIGYMSHDPGYWRFFAYLNLFMFSMLLLVLADSWLVVFVAWELVGLSSYLLIGFWYRKRSAALAAKKAFIVNRVGDVGFALGIMAIFVNTGSSLEGATLNVRESIHRMLELGDAEPDPAVRGRVADLRRAPWARAPSSRSTSGCRTRWRARPRSPRSSTPRRWSTPASTSSPARTRCSPPRPDAMVVVAAIGIFTAILAASIAMTQTDIKRVLAYSTLSQLGYMFAALGVGAFTAAIFHLMTHGFFKGLLFLGSGSVIHAVHEEQDMRNMGGLSREDPDHLRDDAHRLDRDLRASRRWPASSRRTRSSASRSSSASTGSGPSACSSRC